jgi:hypothetical protein
LLRKHHNNYDDDDDVVVVDDSDDDNGHDIDSVIDDLNYSWEMIYILMK